MLWKISILNRTLITPSAKYFIIQIINMINSNELFTFLFCVVERGWIMIFVSWKTQRPITLLLWINDERIYGKGQPQFFSNLRQLLRRSSWWIVASFVIRLLSFPLGTTQNIIGCDVGKVRFLQTLCNLPFSLHVWQNCNKNEQLSKRLWLSSRASCQRREAI